VIPPWPGWTAPAALFAGFAGALIAGLMIAIVAAIFGASLSDPPPAVSIISVIAQDACLIGSALLFARIVAPPRPGLFGLRPAPLRRSVAYVIGGYLVFILASFAWLSIIGEPDAKDTITEDLGAKDSTVALIAVTFVVCVCAPLAEEFFFRGFLFRSLAERMHLAWAALIAGGIFGLVHWPGGSLEGVAVLGTLGVLLCLMVYYTASLLPGIIMHASFNSLAFGSTKELPWWGYLLVLAGSVATTLAISLMATRLGRRAAPGLAPA
jgi:uncharacterized protein